MTGIDARGLRCPWPALRLAKAMREGAGAVRLLADDPAAAREVAALAAEHGWTVARLAEDCFEVVDNTAPERRQSRRA